MISFIDERALIQFRLKFLYAHGYPEIMGSRSK